MDSLHALTRWLENASPGGDAETKLRRSSSRVSELLEEAEPGEVAAFTRELQSNVYRPPAELVGPLLERLEAAGEEELSRTLSRWILRERGGWMQYFGKPGKPALEFLARQAPEILEEEQLEGFAELTTRDGLSAYRTHAKYLRSLPATRSTQECSQVIEALEQLLDRLMEPFSDEVDEWSWLLEELEDD